MNALLNKNRVRRTRVPNATTKGPPAFVVPRERLDEIEVDFREENGETVADIKGIPVHLTDTKNPKFKVLARINRWDSEKREERLAGVGLSIPVDDDHIGTVLMKLDMNLWIDPVDDEAAEADAEQSTHAAVSRQDIVTGDGNTPATPEQKIEAAESGADTSNQPG